MGQRTIARKALGAYEWYAEYSPDFTTYNTSPGNDANQQSAAYANYEKYMDGSYKLGPSGQRAKCGWFAGINTVGSFTDPAFPKYVCSKPFSNPNTPAQGGLQISPSSPGVKTPMSTGAKVAIGAAVVLGAVLLFGGK